MARTQKKNRQSIKAKKIPKKKRPNQENDYSLLVQPIRNERNFPFEIF